MRYVEGAHVSRVWGCALGRAQRLFLVAVAIGSSAAVSQVSVSSSGVPVYAHPLDVPPGINGLQPRFALTYTGGGNGSVGTGWSLQGWQAIRRCPPTRAIDGNGAALRYNTDDKLCLNGQRLIQTDPNGVPLPFPQVGDAAGLGDGAVREYRLESDSYTRVRAYGSAFGTSQTSAKSSAWGPQYFRVWLRSGVVQTFGFDPVIPNSHTALIGGASGQGPGFIWDWSLAREADAATNYIDYTYDSVVHNFGSGAGGGSTSGQGVETRLRSIKYGGNVAAGQGPSVTVQLNYVPRGDGFEVHFGGIKRVYVSVLDAIETHVAGAARDKIQVTYTTSPKTGRYLLTSLKRCTVSSGVTKCLPATVFAYTPGDMLDYATAQSVFKDANGVDNGLSRALLQHGSVGWNRGIVLGDFNGDGRTDIFNWKGSGGADNTLFLSEGVGNYKSVAASGSALGIGEMLFSPGQRRPDVCIASIVADMDGDGLDDVLRYRSPLWAVEGGFSHAPGCETWPNTPLNYFFRSSGDGSFASSLIRDAATGNQILLERKNGTPHPQQPERLTNYANFVLGDFNRDGRMDILSVKVADGEMRMGTASTLPGLYCIWPEHGCRVELWTGLGDGSFTRSLPSFFVGTGTESWAPYIRPTVESLQPATDLDGDGVPDIVYSSLTADVFGVKRKLEGGYISGKTNGDFAAPTVDVPMSCEGGWPLTPGDYNGDGLIDFYCRYNSSVLISQGGSYKGQPSSVPGGMTIDINGDGRTDFFHLNNSLQSIPNKYYLADGRGNFPEQQLPGNLSSTQLYLVLNEGTAAEDIVTKSVVGNFTGSGSLEFLKMNVNTTNSPNQILVRNVPLPADLLASVTTPSGSVTSLVYESVARTSRYASDRNTTYAAAYPSAERGPRAPTEIGPSKSAPLPLKDVTPSMFVVTSMTTDSGVGAVRNTSEFAYRGFKSDHLGRGSLGFREIRQESPIADGTGRITSVRQSLQTYPYVGSIGVAETYLGVMSPIRQPQGGRLLSRTENIYCDQSAAAGAENTATVAAPCAVGSKLLRPYVRKTTQRGWDLTGMAMPTTVTTITYADGYPKVIETQTTGTGPAGTQTFVNSTVNEYFADSIGGDNWLLGLVKKSTVTSSVPNGLGAITTSAGTAPKATATAGP